MEYLRPFQSNVEAQIYAAWNEGCKIVMPVMPTGSGKTRTCGKLLGDETRPNVNLSHRQELVGQWSNSLAEYGVRHAIIAPDAIVREMQRDHMEKFGRSFIDQNSHHCVAGVDSWLNLGANHTRVARTKKFALDEGHHLQVGNKWGRSVEMMPDALGVVPTATPLRADGGGLGRGQGGYVDKLVIGPNARELTAMGYLTDWDIVCPEETVDVSNVPVSPTTGDYVQAKLRDTMHQSRQFVGSVVDAYKMYCPGKLAIVFAVDVEEAGKIAQALRAAGVSAQAVHGKTPGDLRRHIMREFRQRKVQVLVNVDLFGEGTDVPALEVVIMARHTDSFGLYDQQSGRVKRLMIERELARVWDHFTNEERCAHIAASIKPVGLIIDMVGNFGRHGPSDKPRDWSGGLLRRASRGSGKSDGIPTIRCANKDRGDGIPCAKPYPRIKIKCPYCGHTPVPAVRSDPKHVDGDLFLLDRNVLEGLRGAVEEAQSPRVLVPHGANVVVTQAIHNRHREKTQAHQRLRHAMAWWGGRCEVEGYEPREQQRLFFHTFGMDVLTAQALNARDSDILGARILAKLAIDGFVISD